MSNSCFICGQTCSVRISICEYCQSCLPLVKDNKRCIAHNIAVDQPDWNDAYVFYEYKDSVRLLVKRFKFQHNFIAGKILQHLFYERLKNYLQENQYDVIIPMPIHSRRNFKRGYNQCVYFAKYISKRSHIPVDLTYVKRIKYTRYQNKLSLSQRKKNIKQAFNVCHHIPYNSVLIIDDIMTTGYSLNELAITLKSVGINNITVAALSMRLKNS